MSRKTIMLTEDLYEYLGNVSVREPELLAQLREETSYHAEAEMQISPEQGQFMHLLLQLMGAKYTIEIGVFTGYSTLWTALALPDDGHIIACDNNPAWQDIATRYWEQTGVLHKIDFQLAPAMQTLEALLHDGKDEWFDFAFIDADKENYDAYYELCLNLIRPGGLIMIDNVLWKGRVTDPTANDPETKAIRTLNRKIAADQRVTISMLPLSDGLTLVLKQ